MDKIGIVDTTFARFDMGAVAENELKDQPGFGTKFELVRVTVPGIKDLAVACKRLIEREKCSIVLALGMPGRADLDRLSAHEASLGLMAAQLLTSTPILQVFVHETESEDPTDLRNIAHHRAAEARDKRVLDAIRTGAAEGTCRKGYSPGIVRRRSFANVKERDLILPTLQVSQHLHRHIRLYRRQISSRLGRVHARSRPDENSIRSNHPAWPAKTCLENLSALGLDESAEGRFLSEKVRSVFSL